MHIFYTPQPLDISQPYQLEEDESKHAIKVLRLKQGDIINLIDGIGGYYEASVIDEHYKHCTVQVNSLKREFEKRKLKLHIAVAPTKNINRFEWFLEKAVEIGIDEITPLITENSERIHLKLDRFNKIIISAMKQSIKAYLPKMNEPMKFSQFIKNDFDGKKFIAHCYNNDKKHLKESYSKGENALILIGPEGDFSEEEVNIAVRNNYIPVSLGKSRLRTETAAMVSCSIINLLNE